MKLIERQVIVTWFTPDEKLPEDGLLVVTSVSGKIDHITFDHTLMIADYISGEGWFFEYPGIDTEEEMNAMTVHAWCDLEPYGGD